MSQGILGTKTIAQIGILVHDIEATSQAYADLLGVDVPAWNWTDTVDIAKTEYLGQASEARAKLAFFNLGGLQLELIEPDHNPSTWRECLDRNGEGPHHIAFVVNGMKQVVQRLEERGMPVLQRGEYTGGRYAYVDAERDFKVILELLEND
ncbi:glyoxalase/bleomycin resistance protein/dioxygenase superfamily protein [Alicyclobacillus sacchari]|uniref:Glyoxalase/bleomycin resistance protein/dioxygenase superfamily protein n=1 Tax=Alicyclobacillus sacchari TaxID=392010 RepID=A0A4R8LJS5_9BACL|nr:VOC family protein [Alicyclobacillus sacchari]TDY44040.1 glyoxalase/bleomycin resistance protein/dioxygenase superfamily protein [Alicyclobacillus sacchari]GMA58306.1 lactoylglutathione lyase [Alicyclobacillus sacchari]